MLASIPAEVATIPLPEGLDMVRSETSVMRVMAERWKRYAPDVVVVGGWPFAVAAARAAEFGIKSIFNDHGAVAHDGLTGPALTIQLELRRLRQLALPYVDQVLPVSSFIRRSQSELDRGRDSGMQVMLHGADHMALGITGGDRTQRQNEALLAHLTQLIAGGAKLVLALGRFEAQGYKNSPAAYEVLRAVRQQIPEARLLILDAGSTCDPPADVSTFVEFLGAPDDLTLQAIMRLSSAGISTSLWEGFNLPIAEMQWLDRPALAFNLGGHPEVIAEPWLLCENVAEMAAKLVTLLHGTSPVDLHSRFAAFRERFLWAKTLTRWEEAIGNLAATTTVTALSEPGSPRKRRLVLVDVSNASLDPANPGVIRVVRRLSSELQRNRNLELVFAAWNPDSADYIFLNETRRNFLKAFAGPSDGLGLLASYGRETTPGELIEAINVDREHQPLLFLPEVLLDGHAISRVEWAKARGFRCAAILHDLIPIYNPELCDPGINQVFPRYLEAILQLDAVWSNSDFTQSELGRYAGSMGKSMPGVCSAVWLPGQLGEQLRRVNSGNNGSREIRILCVSTLEPRKNHVRLIEAFRMLRSRRPELPLRLILVGNRYAGAPEIADYVEAAQRQDPSIEWQGPTDDGRLASEFDQAAFTVYASLVEGFGLPIMESLWMGCPCLTHSSGVMSELAGHGGCVTSNMNDSASITQALERMATDPVLLAQLRGQACARSIGTWQDYAREIGDRLLRV